MKSIKELYKIGNGPSSSHTMGPKRACEYMKEKNKDADEFIVYLYGSLALTGKGHLTDKVIANVFKDKKLKIIFDIKTPCNVHPNTMEIEAYRFGKLVDSARIYSVGGGIIKIEGNKFVETKDIYNEKNLDEIKKYIKKKNISILDYIIEKEDANFKDYLLEVFNTMKDTLEKSLKAEGKLPGKLDLNRKAKNIYENIPENERPENKKVRLLTAYAYAVSEANATGEIVVTAPTCGAAGIVPAVMYYLYKDENVALDKIIEGLAVAGLFGNIVKQNASISGAEAGCQAEVGTACSMAAAMTAYIYGLDIEKIERAAEIAMEHHLGLTCDPILGYVQIPCIERNAVGAIRAVDAAIIASLYSEDGKISFDTVVDTMYETGKDLKSHYRETSTGGLAKKYCRNKFYNKDIE